ncbi:MAG: DoxX family protein [Muribaculaceae bacterium]|nr:DoxX family protein [Muribaculaceae bacterium]
MSATASQRRLNITLPMVVTLLVRLAVGGVFIFSGFVKAVDPWGTYYKVSEYMLAMGLTEMVSLSLFTAMALPVLEMMLGVLTAVGAYRRSVPWLMLVFMLVMTPITLWLAVTNAVPDCGCFGDVLHLSNWATFGKNLLLLAGVIYLILFNRRLPSIYGPAVQWVAAALVFAYVMMLVVPSYFVQPLIDFRPYEVGTRLTSAAASTASVDEDDYVFIYERNGEQREFTIDNAPDDGEGWTFVDRRMIKKPAAQSRPVPAHSIAIRDNGLDVSDAVLDPSGDQLLFLFPDLPEVSVPHTFLLNNLNDFATERGAAIYGLTSASEQQMLDWEDIAMSSYPLYTADDTEIKMLARGNPAVVYVQKGIIRWKRTLTSIDASKLRNPEQTLTTLNDDNDDPDGDLMSAFYFLMAGLALLLVVNRTHLLVLSAWRRWRKAK